MLLYNYYYWPKSLAKMFEGKKLDEFLSVIDTLLWEPDKYKQRAAAEFLAGLLRGKLGSEYQWIKSYVGYRVETLA